MKKYSLLLLCCTLAYPIFSQNPAFLPIKSQGKWGYIDTLGKMVVPPEFQYLDQFNAQGSAIAQKNNKFGMIHIKGETLVPFQYQNIEFLNDTLISVLKDKWGVINLQGQVFIPEVYERIKLISQKSNSFLALSHSDGLKYINWQGKALFPPAYERPYFITDSLVLARKEENTWAISSLDGKTIQGQDFQDIKLLPLYIYLEKNGRAGLINKKGQEILALQYEDIFVKSHLANNAVYLEVHQDGLVGIFDNLGQEIIPINYAEIEPCPTGGFIVSQGQEKGLMHDSGKLLLEPAYNAIQQLEKHYLKISKNGKVGIYDYKRERICLPLIYDQLSLLKANEESQDKFLVFKNGKTSVVDIQGKTIVKEGTYENIQFDEAGVFLTQKNGKWGLATSYGQIEPQFDEISSFQRNLALVRLGQRYGLINILAQIIAQPKYRVVKMIKNTARLYEKEGPMIYLTLNNQGAILDRVQITNFKQIKVKKAKEENTWDFNFNPQNIRPVFSRDTSQISLSSSLNSQPIIPQEDVNVGNYTWFYSLENRRWGLKDSNDSLILEPKFTQVDTFPRARMSMVASVVKTRDREGNTQFLSNYGLIDNLTGAFVIRPRPGKGIEAAIRDFELDSAARQYNYYIRRDRKRLSTLPYQDEYSVRQVRIYFATPYEWANLSQANIFGWSRDARKRFVSKKEEVRGGYWGLVDRRAKVVVPPIYEAINPIDASFAKVLKAKKQGIINTQGQEIVAPIFYQVDYLPETDKRYFLLTHREARFGFVDTTAQIKINLAFKAVKPFQEGRAMVMKDDKLWTFINTQGQEIVEDGFYEVRGFSENRAAVRGKRHWGFIDPQGQIITKMFYTRVGNYHENRAWVRKGSALGYLDEQGKKVTPIHFRAASDFHQGRAIVNYRGKSGVIDRQGNWIVEPKYYSIESYDTYGLARFRKTYKKRLFGLFNRQGKIIASPNFKDIKALEQGRFLVKKGKKFGFLDTLGNLISHKMYDQVLPFREGYAAVKVGKMWGMIDSLGHTVISPQYIQMTSFYQGAAKVKRGQEQFYIDPQGNRLKHPPSNFTQWHNPDKFEEVHPFYEGIAAYRLGKLWGFVRENGQVLFQATFQEATDFYNGYALVRAKNKRLFVDKYGQYMKELPNDTEWLDRARPFFKVIWQDKKCGFLSRNGVELSNPKFSYLGDFKEAFAPVAVSDFYGIADRKGNIILPAEYETIAFLGSDIFRVEKDNAIGYWHTYLGWIWKLTK